MHSQIFHAPTKPSKPFWNDPKAIEFANSHFDGARYFRLDSEILKFAAESASLEGLWIELGVASGRTIRFLAKTFPYQRIYGFDSFKGLPEDWIRGDKTTPKGCFMQEKLPEVPENIHLIEGWFEETLHPFAKEHKCPISFLHMDCDLYSSTKEAFKAFGEHIVSKTIILFDELYNYPGSEEHEFKAFEEFLEQKSLTYRVLGFNAMHEQAVVQIV
ncbi:MAG: class I SAM-dependent methyltransferase [Verrucomicrobia bacterium]|nr:class I SAM-dependent methyltransferase [Verrucomicrobiota bacterium]